MEIPKKYMKVLCILTIIFCVVGSVYFVVKIVAGFEDGNWKENKTENTISFSGHGEVSAVPDIANINFTIEKDAKTVKEAQNEVAKIEKQALDFLKTNNVADKDIKTTNASFYPKYDFVYTTDVVCGALTCPPRPTKQVIVGYTASESITVKIRNTDDSGKIIQGLGTLGISNLDGPNFAIDNEDNLKDNARKLAIDEAKIKAKKLAKDLGIRLGKITSFGENGNYPMPMYAKGIMADSAMLASAPAVIPKGENLITSDVTITYEIK